MKRILYVSVHEPLHFDEVILFQELGYDVKLCDVDLKGINSGFIRPNLGVPYDSTVDQISDFDIIIVMHDVGVLEKLCKIRSYGQRVILRTIGQNDNIVEGKIKALQGQIEIVRYSPRERNLENFAGENALIRIYKDPTKYPNWIGGGGISMFSVGFCRRNMPDHNVLDKMLSYFNWNLYGINNTNHPNFRNVLQFEQMPYILTKSDIYVSPHSTPASYTLNFIESLMAGVPVVSVSRDLITNAYASDAKRRHLALQLFELDELVQDGKSAFLVSNLEDGVNKINLLTNSLQLRHEVGAAGRERAIQYFSKHFIGLQWKQYLN